MKQMEQISIRKCQLLNLRTQMRRFETYKIDPLQIQISPSPPDKRTPRCAFHKADLPAENIVGRWLAAAESNRYRIIKRREMNPRPTTKGVRSI